jgi:SAM-dependent methyltransferase
MYEGKARYYFEVGLSAARCIERSVKQAGNPQIANVPDLPCGHGRVLRFLLKLFPGARFTACDLDRDGVYFCAKTFGASPVYSSERLDDLSLGQRFDLTWCGSLVTHLNAPEIQALLRALARRSAPWCSCRLGSARATAAKWMAEGAFDHGVRTGQIGPMLEEFERTRFAYRNYAHTASYGISLSWPDWIRQQVQEVGGLREVHFEAHGWAGHQDVFAFAS